MPFDGSGNFTRSMNWQADAAAGIKILASRHDTEDENFRSGLSLVLCRDGQGGPSADMNWNNKKLLNLAAAVNPTDAVTLGQVQAYNATIGANPSGIVISGSTPNSMLKFTGTTGPWGDSYVTNDLFFGTAGAAATAYWKWNDKADTTGNDTMILTPDNAGVNRATLTLKSVDDTVASGPWLNFDRFSPSPAIGDTLGAIGFNGKSSTGITKEFAAIYASCNDPANGSEDGSLTFRTVTAGTSTIYMNITDKVEFPQARINLPGGVLFFDSPTVNSEIFLNKNASGGYTYIMGQTAGKHRWMISLGDATAETGSNAGSNFALVRYDDAGTAGVSFMICNRQNLTTQFPGTGGVEVGNFSSTGAGNGQLLGTVIDCSRSLSSAVSQQRFYTPSGQAGAINTTNATTAYVTTSDIRTKTGIKEPTNVRALVDAIQVIEYIPAVPEGVTVEAPATFDGVEPASPEVILGIPAQQAYTVYPQAVSPPDTTVPNYNAEAQFGEEGFAPWMIDHSKFVPMLMANVQDLNARNDALEARLAQLETAA